MIHMHEKRKGLAFCELHTNWCFNAVSAEYRARRSIEAYKTGAYSHSWLSGVCVSRTLPALTSTAFREHPHWTCWTHRQNITDHLHVYTVNMVSIFAS